MEAKIAGSDHSPAIIWFRNDLRLRDHPAVDAAVAQARPLVFLYILEETERRPLGGAGKWWLDKSLRSLAADIEDRGGALTLRRGDPIDVLRDIVSETGATALYWSRRYGEPERSQDADIKSTLKSDGLEARSFNGSLLSEPWAIETSAGGHYKVFTPFWKALRADYVPPAEIAAPEAFEAARCESESIDDWGLHPQDPDWSAGFDTVWTPGEDGARARLADFLERGLDGYSDNRNRPDLDWSTSGLSPHLRFGEISPAQIWRATAALIEAETTDVDSAWTFLSELAWRDFAYVLLYHNPDLATKNYNGDFDHMPWRTDAEALRRWTKGETGYPIVDAGMRQLWQTGWMHNRVRMIVASFLTKHLLIHWSEGEAWFWDTLVDADPASNAASWQWTAGSGADAAPYFRVFNPITQGEKFDETGDYVRKWCPELSKLPRKHLYAPWTASDAVLKDAGVQLGETYPEPIIEHASGRARALDAYETLKNKRDAA